MFQSLHQKRALLSSVSGVVIGFSEHFVDVSFCMCRAQGKTVRREKEDSIIDHGHMVFEDFSLVCP